MSFEKWASKDLNSKFKNISFFCFRQILPKLLYRSILSRNESKMKF